MTLTTSEPKQFTLNDKGQICWQADPTNPLPGEPVAILKKGESALSPVVELLDTPLLAGQDFSAVGEKLGTWLALHMTAILEPLIRLTVEMDPLPEPVKGICQRVYDTLGIIPRADLLDLIDQLDPDMRKTLRTRHVRLGPVLVFVPDLNRPAAVRLRALLWSLFNDKPLPAPVPRDGAVSVMVEEAGADPAFYQAIGYPLYGGRAIRIDMLDRVISAVYDNVKDNHFQARHEMAEWLGCSIPDLYKVLESMGHRKTYDPAEHPAPEAISEGTEAAQESPPKTPEPTPAPAPSPETSTETSPEASAEPGTETAAPPAPSPQVKPTLATFRVFWPRRARPAGHLAHPHHPAAEGGEGEPAQNHARRGHKGRRGGPEGEEGERPQRRGKPQEGSFRGDRPDRGPRKSKPTKADKNLGTFGRVHSAGPTRSAPEDSPFAILGQLITKKDA